MEDREWRAPAGAPTVLVGPSVGGAVRRAARRFERLAAGYKPTPRTGRLPRLLMNGLPYGIAV